MPMPTLKRPSAENEKTSGCLSASERAIWVCALMVAGASTFQARWLWRWPQKAVDPYLLLAAVVGVILFAPLIMRGYARLDWGLGRALEAGRARLWGRWPRVIKGAVGLLIAAAVIYYAFLTLFDLRASRFYGDAGAVVGFVKKGVVFHKREPLSPAIFLAAYQWVGAPAKMSAMTTVQMTTALAGGFGIWALIGLARHLCPGRPLLAAMGACALVSAGALQLFAGYIENYTVPAVLGLWALYLGLRALRLGRSVAPAVICHVLACCVHLSMITLAPAMLWLIYRGHLRDHGGLLRGWLRWQSVPLVLGAALPVVILWACMAHYGYHRAEEVGYGGGDGLMFVPWSEKTGMSQYTFFSGPHLLAILNLQWLVAPLALVTVLGIGAATLGSVMRSWRGGVEVGEVGESEQDGESQDGGRLDSGLIFLVLAGLGHLGLTLIWNPDLGPKRDWDLFGPVGFFLSAAAVALIVRRYTPPRAFALLCLTVAVNLCRTLPFMLHNMRL